VPSFCVGLDPTDQSLLAPAFASGLFFSKERCNRYTPLSFQRPWFGNALGTSTDDAKRAGVEPLFSDGHHIFCVRHLIQSHRRGQEDGMTMTSYFPMVDALTSREREITSLVSVGLSNKEIAQHLNRKRSSVALCKSGRNRRLSDLD
jgi:hypothetical protein